MSEHILVIGGGVMGCATAWALARDPAFGGQVTVLERDPTYRTASSALSASSIRQQFSTPLNIAMSQYGLEVLRDMATLLGVPGQELAMDFTEHGYLYLADATQADALQARHAVQQACGAAVELMTPTALAAEFPWLDLDGVVLGALGRRGEGWFDGYTLMQAFRRKARALGVQFRQAEARGLRLTADTVVVDTTDGDIGADRVVNAAGAWSQTVSHWMGLELPVQARRRCVFVMSSPAVLHRCPLLIDTTGVWLRPEGRHYIGGIAPADDRADLPLEVDHAEFDEVLWPTLARRIPGFEALRVESAWAGYYEFNPHDHNAWLGPHPDDPRLMFITGFSGHGMQHAAAAGRYLAELIVHGRPLTLDCSALAPARWLRGERVREDNVI